MPFDMYGDVVLTRDVPQHGVRAGSHRLSWFHWRKLLVVEPANRPRTAGV